jgi:hypothetical protein
MICFKFCRYKCPKIDAIINEIENPINGPVDPGYLSIRFWKLYILIIPNNENKLYPIESIIPKFVILKLIEFIKDLQ